MHHFHQVTLRFHNVIDILVSCWNLINHIAIFTAFYALSLRDLIGNREFLFCLST